jgi:hypothetical protein
MTREEETTTCLPLTTRAQAFEIELRLSAASRSNTKAKRHPHLRLITKYMRVKVAATACDTALARLVLLARVYLLPKRGWPLPINNAARCRPSL